MAEELGISSLFSILPDGSVARSEFFTPFAPASEDPALECLSRDVVLDSTTGLTVRLFLPAGCIRSNNSKVPLVVYVHGGGFCMCRSSTTFIHNFCEDLAKAAQVLVVSVDYRLAPEHRLPAAYEDCSQVLEWVTRHSSSFSDPLENENPNHWISAYADTSRCFLMGESSGANILHHVMLKNTGPNRFLEFEGLILVHPFFGGEARTLSEIEFAKQDLVMPVDLCDELWRHCLPVGSTRDHPYCNPFHKDLVSLVKVDFPRILLVVGDRNSLQDRQVEYFKLLKSSGKDVGMLFLMNVGHAFEFVEAKSDQAKIMLEVIVQFMNVKCSARLSRSASVIHKT